MPEDNLPKGEASATYKPASLTREQSETAKASGSQYARIGSEIVPNKDSSLPNNNQGKGFGTAPLQYGVNGQLTTKAIIDADGTLNLDTWKNLNLEDNMSTPPRFDNTPVPLGYLSDEVASRVFQKNPSGLSAEELSASYKKKFSESGYPLDKGDETMVKADIFRKALYGSDVNLNNSLDVSILNYGSVPTSDLFYEGVQGEVAFPYRRYQEWNESLINNGLYNKPSDRLMDESFNSANIDVKSQLAMQKMREADPLTYRAMQLGIHPSVGIWASLSNNPFDLVHSNISKAQEDLIAAGRLNPDFSLTPAFTPTLKSGDFQQDSPSSAKALSSQMESLSVIQNQLNSDVVAIKGEIDNDVQSSPEYKAYKESADLYNKESADWAGTFSKDVVENYSNKLTQATKFYNDNKAEIDEAIATRGEYDKKYKFYENEQDLNVKENYRLELSTLEEKMLKSFNYKQYNKKAEELNKLSSQKDIEAYNQASNPQSAVFKARESLLESSASLREKEATTRAKYQDKISEFEDRQTSLYLSVVKENENSEAAGFIPYVTGVKYSEINKDNVVEVFQNLFDNLSDVKYANFLSDRNNETAYSAYVKNGILPELDRYTSSDTKGGLLTPDDASMLRSQSYINSTVSQKINYILDMVAKAPDYYNQVYKDAFDLQTIDGVKGLNSKAIEDYNAKGLIYESLSSIRIKAQAKTNMDDLEEFSKGLSDKIIQGRLQRAPSLNSGSAIGNELIESQYQKEDRVEYEKLNLAKKITQGILRTVDEGIPVDSFMQGVKDVVRGVKDSLLQDPLSYVPFISSIVSLDDQTVVYDILNRKKNGEILSTADNMVLESMALNQLQSTYINKDNIYYNTYNSFPKTVAFMGELFVGNMLGGVIFNTASKMLEGAYSFLFRGMANAEATGVLLTTGKTVKGLFGSAEWLTSSEGVANFKKVMSYASSLGSQNIATLGSVANSTMERLSPPLVVSQSQYEQGRILFEVMENQETTSGALKKSLISNLISVTVEGWGGVIDKGIGLTFKGLSVSGRTILDSVSHGVSSSTSPKAIAFTRFVKSISENPKLIQAFKSNTFVRGSSTLYRGLTFGENGAFPILSSLPAETMEEVIDSGLQMAILGEGPALWKKDPIAQATKIATQAMYVMSPLYMFRFGGAVLRTSARAVGSMATMELSESDFNKNSIIAFPNIGGKSIIGMTIRKSEYKAVQSLINELGNTDRTVDPAKIQSLERSLLGNKHMGGKERGLISGRGMFELMKQTFEYHNEYLNSTSDLTFGKYVKEITDAKKALNARINEAIANDIKDKSEMSRQEINDERNENLALMESVANTPTSEKAKQEMRNIIDVAKKYYASGQTAVTLKQLLKEAEVLDSRIKERYHRLVNKGVATSIGGVFADINRLAELTGDTRLYSNEARVMRGVIDNNPILDYDSINKALDSDNNVIADYVNQALDREVISIHSGIGITATVSVQDNGKRVLSIDRSEEEVKDLLDTIDINSPYYNKLLYALTSKGATFSDGNSTVNVAVEIARDLMSSAFEEDDKFHFNPLVKGLYLVNRLALNDDLNPTIIDEVMTMFRGTEMFGYSKSDQSYYVNKDLYRMMSATFTAMTQMNGLFNEDTKMTPMGLLSEIDKMKVISDELHEHYTGTIQDYIPEVLDADDNSSLIEDAPLIDSDFTGTVDSSKMRAKDILLTVARFMEKVIGMKPYQAKNIRQIMERTANGLVAAGVYKDVETALRSMPLYSYATNANHTRESQDFRNIAEHLLKNSDFAFEVKFLTGDEMRAKSLELGITNMSSVDSYQAGVTPLPTGFFHEGVVYLNSDMPVNNALGSDRNVYTSNSVLIRQFAMPFLENLKKTNPEVYLEGVKKLKSRDGKVLLDYLRAKNPGLKGEALSMEALLLLTTEQGDILLQNAKEKSLTEWVEKFWDWVKGKIGLPNTATDKLKAMSLADYGTATAISVLQGNKSGSIESGMSKEEIHANDIKNKFRATFAGKGVKDVHIDAALAIMDIRAQAWASEKKGRKAEQWYSRIADIGTGEFNIRGQVQYQMEDGRTAETTPEMDDVVDGFYSALARNIAKAKQDKMPAKQWLDKFANTDEAKWTGLTEWLKSKEGSVTKKEIQDFLKDNRVEILQVVNKSFEKTEESLIQEIENAGYFVEYNEDEGMDFLVDENGEEADVATAPGRVIALFNDYIDVSENGTSATPGTRHSKYTESDPNDPTYKEILVVNAKHKGKPFVHPVHFDQENILVHLRSTIRYDEDGRKVLFLEEIQSDWGQEGRNKGFISPEESIKNEQFLKDREIWNELKSLLYLANESLRKGKKHYNEIKELEAYGIRRVLGLSEFGENPVYTKVEGEPKKEDIIKESDLPEGYLELRKLVDSRIDYRKSLEFFIKEIEDKYGVEEIDGELKIKEALSSSPFVEKTTDWVKLGLKVALRQAIASGAEAISWTTGEQQNVRYGKEKEAKSIRYKKNDNGTYSINVYGKDKNIYSKKSISLIELNKLLGEDMANSISNNEGEEVGGEMVLEGNGVKVGGKGMKDFYGSVKDGTIGIIGDVAKKLFKNEVEYSLLQRPNLPDIQQATVYITPEMRATEKSGQPLFQDQKGKKRGAVETLEDGRVIIHALESPDVSTLVHEIFHVFEKDLTPDEVAQVEALGGSEVFANAGVRYLHDGVAPTPELQPLFEKFASWLGSIYKNLRTSLIGKNVNPAIKTMLERLLTVTPPTEGEIESRGTSTNTGVFDNIDMRFDSESGELTFYKDGNQVSFINATAEWFYDQVMKNQNNGVNSSAVKTSITEAVNELMEQYKEGGKSNSSKWIEREAERMRYENPDADESVIDDIMRRRLFAKAIEAYIAGGKEYKINSKENPDGSFVFRRVAKATQLHKAFRAFAKFFSKYAEKEDGKFNSTEFPFKLNNLIIKAANAMFNIDTTGKSYFFHFNKWRGSSAADEIKSSTKANKEIIKSIAEHFDSNLESLSPESIEEALDFIHSNMQKVKVDILKAVKGKLTLTAKQISDLMFTPRMNSPQEYLAHLAKEEKYFTDSKYREKIDNLQKAIDGARARQKSSSKKDSDFGKSMRELLRVPIKAFIKEKDIVKFTNIFNTIYQNSDQEVTQKNKELARSIYEDYLLSKQMEDQARRDNLQDNASVAEYLDEVIGLDELEIARLTGMEVADINKIDGEYKKIWKAGKRKGLARSLNVNDMAELDDESRRIDNDTIQARREVIEQQRQISLAKVSNNDIISDLIADIDLEDLSFKELNKFSGMLTYIANNGRPNKDISDFVIAYMAKRNDTYVKNNANKRFKRMLDDAADRNHWFNNFHWNPVTFSMIKENGRLGLPRALLSLGAISNYTLIHFIDFLDGMTNNMRGHISNLITSPIQDAEERFEKAMTEIMTNVGKLKADMTVEELYLSGITSLLNQKSKINFNRDIVEAKVLSLKKQEEGVDPVTGRAIIIEDMDSADEKYDSLDQHSKELYDVIAELQQPNNQEALANLRANPDIAYTDFYYYDPYDGQYKIHDDVDTSGFRYRIYEAVNKKKLRNVAASIIFSLGGDPSLVFKEYEGMMKNLQGENRFESVKNTSMKIDNHLVAKSLKQIYGVSSIEKMVEDIFNGNVNYDTPQSIALKNYTRQVFTKIRNGDYSDGLDMEYAGNIFSNTGFEDIQDYAPLIRYGEFNNKTHSIDQAGVRPLEMTATEGAFVDTDVMKSSVNVNSSFMRRRGSSLSLLELSAFEQIRKKADQELFYLNHEPHRRMLHTLTNTEGGFFSTWKTDQSNKYSSGYFREPNMQSQANQDVRLSPGAAKDFQQKLSAFYIRNMTPSKIALNNSHVSKYIMDSWNLMKASILSASYASVSQMSVLFSLPQEYDNFVPTGAATNIMDTLEALTDVGKDRFEDFIMEHAPEVALRGVSVYNLANIKPGKLADRIMLVASSLNGQGNKIALKNKAALAERIRLFKDGYELLEFLKQSNKSGNASDSDIILMQVLAFDRYAAKITFHSAYKNFLKDIGEDVNYDNPNQDAIDFAIALIRRTQNSDASIWKPGYNIGIGKGVNFHEDGSRGEVIRQSWFSFKSFSINEQTNQRRNAIMTLTDPDKGTAQKINDLANVLLSGLANRAAYEISKKYLKGLMVQSLLTMQYWLGWDDDDYNQPSKDGLWEHGTIKESLVRAEKIIRELNNKNGVSIASLESGYTQIKGYDYYDTYYQITDLLFKLGLSEVGSGSLAGLARGYVGNLVDQRSTSVNEDGDIVKKDISKTLFPITQDTEGVLSDALPLLDMLSYTTDLAFLFKTAGGNLDYLLNKDDYNGEVPDDVLTWRNQKGKLYRALINSLLMFNVGLRGKSNFPSSLPFVRPRDTDVIIKTMNKANDFNKVDTKKVEINLED